MIICPNCDYQNPVGAVQCESCLSTLPSTIFCPRCNASLQGNAIFCGQCGFDLRQKITNPKLTYPTLVQEPEVEENLQIHEEETLDLSNQQSATPALEVEKEEEEIFPAISASLLHVQTDTLIDLPSELKNVRLGKANEKLPPDLDLAGLPDSQFISRAHAVISREGHFFYIEDLGSANGTYVNHISLVKGKRHPISNGSRIALGREDRVSFIFQVK